MDISLKSLAAELVPIDDEANDPVGSFHAIITSPKLDRDGDELWAEEWEQPLPDHIQIVGDHDNSHIMSTIGSGPPVMESDNKIHVRGTYATTGYAQDARKLVNGKHLRHLSVAYREKTNSKGVSRELINASFVNVPSNTDAVVLESKSMGGKATPNDMPGSPRMSEEAKALVQDIVKSALENQSAYVDPVLKRLGELGIEIEINEVDSTICVKHDNNVLGTHKFSQKAPSAPGQPADSTADQDAKDAEALAKAKAAAILMQHKAFED